MDEFHVSARDIRVVDTHIQDEEIINSNDGSIMDFYLTKLRNMGRGNSDTPLHLILERLTGESVINTEEILHKHVLYKTYVSLCNTVMKYVKDNEFLITLDDTQKNDVKYNLYKICDVIPTKYQSVQQKNFVKNYASEFLNISNEKNKIPYKRILNDILNGKFGEYFQRDMKDLYYLGQITRKRLMKEEFYQTELLKLNNMVKLICGSNLMGYTCPIYKIINLDKVFKINKLKDIKADFISAAKRYMISKYHTYVEYDNKHYSTLSERKKDERKYYKNLAIFSMEGRDKQLVLTKEEIKDMTFTDFSKKIKETFIDIYTYDLYNLLETESGREINLHTVQPSDLLLLYNITEKGNYGRIYTFKRVNDDT